MYTDAEIIYSNVKKLEEEKYRVQGKKKTWDGLTDIQKLRFALIAAGKVLKTVKISSILKKAGGKKKKKKKKKKKEGKQKKKKKAKKDSNIMGKNALR